VLLLGFRVVPEVFRTGWFVESLLTELVVALVLRTRKSVFKSRPGRVLLWSTVVVAIVALAIPFIPGAEVLGFVPLPLPILGALIGITAAYVTATEWLKLRFFPKS
jgi:P-type Mg2+ transporter